MSPRRLRRLLLFHPISPLASASEKCVRQRGDYCKGVPPKEFNQSLPSFPSSRLAIEIGNWALEVFFSQKAGASATARANVQGLKKWFANCDKHYPSRSGQISLATAVANFTKPRTSHLFDLCRVDGRALSITCGSEVESRRKIMSQFKRALSNGS